MRQSLKKAITVGLSVLALTIGTALTGCGSNTASNGSGTNTGANSKNVELSVWIPLSPDQEKPLQKIIDQFNSDYNSQHISAKLQFFTWDNYPQKLSVAMKGGVGPDVLFNGAAATAGLVESNTVIPLDKYLKTDSQVSNIIPGFEEQTKYKGHSWFVPMHGNVLLLEYRKDLFEQANLTSPKSWDELLTDAKKLSIPNKRLGMALGTNGVALEQAYSEFLYSNGGNFVDSTGTQATLNTPQALQSMEQFQKFFKAGAASVKLVPPAGQDPLGTGQAAMEAVAPNLPTLKQNYPSVYDKIGYVPFPTGPNGTGNVTYGAADGFYISSQTKHPDEAWKLLQYLLKNSADVTKVIGGIPPLSNDQHVSWIESDSGYKEVIAAINQSKVTGNPNVPQWISVRNTFAQDAQQVLYGQSPKSVLTKANQDIQKDLSQK
jgi:multiple sugar transport system substrate-binding protein